MSDRPFEGIEPAYLWKHFEALTQLRRPSGEEEEAVAYVTRWAQEHAFPFVKDKAGNVVVKVPASKGCETAATVVLQGHLDMVCERNADSPYDAREGRLHVVREGDWITADGTTLGADNGIGVAAALAAAEDPGVKHPPLELLLTIDEETGMTGARELEPEHLEGRLMLNLDSEEDDLLFVGCSGGMDTRFRLAFETADAPSSTVFRRLSLSGLKGGHSGLDINHNRMNAIAALARILDNAGIPLRLASIDGGKMRNAIPREAEAVVSLAAADVDAFGRSVEATVAELKEQFAGLDDGLVVEVKEEQPRPVMDEELSRRLIRFLRALPSGVIAMSQDIEGLVETSTNLGVVHTAEGQVEAVSCSRSSVGPALRMVTGQLNAIAALAGVEAQEEGGYPGWKPNLDSKALKVVRQSYEDLFGDEPQVTAIHAGLECGLLGEKVKGMDMVSFGPTIRGAHSPDEKVSIPSTQKFYRLLSTVLERLC